MKYTIMGINMLILLISTTGVMLGFKKWKWCMTYLLGIVGFIGFYFTYGIAEMFTIVSFFEAIMVGVFSALSMYLVIKFSGKEYCFEKGVTVGMGFATASAGFQYVFIYILEDLFEYVLFDDMVNVLPSPYSHNNITYYNQSIIENVEIVTGTEYFAVIYEVFWVLIMTVAFSTLITYFVSLKKDVWGLGISVVFFTLTVMMMNILGKRGYVIYTLFAVAAIVMTVVLRNLYKKNAGEV